MLKRVAYWENMPRSILGKKFVCALRLYDGRRQDVAVTPDFFKDQTLNRISMEV